MPFNAITRDQLNNLGCATLMPFNAIVDSLRKGKLPSMVDVALNVSKKIEETPMMRDQMRDQLSNPMLPQQDQGQDPLGARIEFGNSSHANIEQTFGNAKQEF